MRLVAVITLLALAAAPVGSDAQSGPIGDSPLPPDLNPDELIFFEDFDGPTTTMDELLADEGTSSSITSEVAFSGNRSLEMDGTKGGKFSRRYPLGGAWDDLYARYMFRIGEAESSCWHWDEHYKLMGFEGGTEDCKGGKYRSDGTDCFSVRTRFNYPYLGLRVESAPFPGKLDLIDTRTKVDDGNWHCLEFRVKLNRPGEKDGVIQLWVDGREKTKKKLHFRRADTLRIDKWWFTYWSNDDWCGPLYIDDLVVSQGRIGCPAAP